MIALLYDNSFEGLLTAIFEIYEYKYTDVKILSHQNIQNVLFGENNIVITNTEKADRVMLRIEKQLGANAIRQFLYAFASEDHDRETIISQIIFYAIANPSATILDDYSNPYVLQLSKWVKSVGREKHRMEAFVRFELLKDAIYFATIRPDFDVLPLLVTHFKERYQDQKWLIYDEKRQYGIFYDLNEVTVVTLPDKKMLSKNKETIWHEAEVKYQNLLIEYFDHTNIKERKNTKLHLQHVPKRYWRYLTEKR